MGKKDQFRMRSLVETARPSFFWPVARHSCTSASGSAFHPPPPTPLGCGPPALKYRLAPAPPIRGAGEPEFLLAGSETLVHQRLRIGREDGKQILFAERLDHLPRGVVGVSQGAIRGELEHRIGAKLRKGGQLLDLDFGQLAVGDVGEGAGKAFGSALGVEGDLSIDFDPAHFAALGEEAGLVAAIFELSLDKLQEDVPIMRLVFLMDVFKKEGA